VALPAFFLPWVLQMGHIQFRKRRISGTYSGRFGPQHPHRALRFMGYFKAN
jgi:hypothetical protein